MLNLQHVTSSVSWSSCLLPELLLIILIRNQLTRVEGWVSPCLASSATEHQQIESESDSGMVAAHTSLLGQLGSRRDCSDYQCSSRAIGVVMQVHMMKEERLVAEGALEEARSKEMEQRSRAEALKQEVELQRGQVQRHLTQVPHLSNQCCCPSYASASIAAVHAMHRQAMLPSLSLSHEQALLTASSCMSKEFCRSSERVDSSHDPRCCLTQVSALRVDVQLAHSLMLCDVAVCLVGGCTAHALFDVV